MGRVFADGRVLWLSGRYDGEVYAVSTQTGLLLARIVVGSGPHGLCVWPQPGRTRSAIRASFAENPDNRARREGREHGDHDERRRHDPGPG
jgi:hypothetical protein